MELAIIVLLVAGMTWVYKKLFVSCPPDGGPKKIGFGGWIVVLAASTLLIGALDQSEENKNKQSQSQQIVQNMHRVEQQLTHLDELMTRYDREKFVLENRLSRARDRGMSLEEAHQNPFLEETARRLSNLRSWSETIDRRRQELRTRWVELDRHRFQAEHTQAVNSALEPTRSHDQGSKVPSGDPLGSLEEDRRHSRLPDPSKIHFSP